MFFDPEADASQCAIKLSPQPISPEECSFRLTCVSIRRVHHYYTTQGRRGNIDIVDADPRATNNPEIARCVQKGCCDFRFAAHNQSFAICEGRHQIRMRQTCPLLYGKRGGAQGLKTTLAYIISYEYF